MARVLFHIQTLAKFCSLFKAYAWTSFSFPTSSTPIPTLNLLFGICAAKSPHSVAFFSAVQCPLFLHLALPSLRVPKSLSCHSISI